MKIVLTGPESVGKSMLSKQLAYIYQGVYVEEFARKYIEELKSPYTYQDVVNITKQQLKEYDHLQKKDGFCFFDTYLIISKIWFLHVFNKLPDWFEDEFAQRPVDLYLLCKDDLDWKPDLVRENRDIRGLLFEKYKQQLEAYGFAYKIIEGSGEQRVRNAVDAIDKMS
ncbi:AAA family ATPase [Saccharicrinis fermentans]|uniref:ATPase/kinase n=1 Tax=Saccharicrinis fermentans DSM 9555 = JCM 21142 TaxID=869213 RepID=W7YNW6_9BACT|nr:ATP-binding protein [Saccharicrinis fermentans]GAF04074.1 ATPase/kinase [Saccharicrinis fermentans DSM 9555 = JCM 21142]